MARPKRTPGNQKISPYQQKGRSFFLVSFYHPKAGKNVTRGLGTDDFVEARIICNDLQTLCNTPACWDKPPAELKLLDKRALTIFFGEQETASIMQQGEVSKKFVPQSIETLDALVNAHPGVANTIWPNHNYNAKPALMIAEPLKKVLDQATLIGATDIIGGTAKIAKLFVESCAVDDDEKARLNRQVRISTTRVGMLEREIKALQEELQRKQEQIIDLQRTIVSLSDKKKGREK